MLHTFWVGNLRLVLDAVLTSGKEHSSGHAKAPLARLLDELGGHAPALVRGDCGYGNEDTLVLCEQRSLSHLLRLRKTTNVKRLIERLIERLFKRQACSEAPLCGQSWQASEDELRLSGWSRARRVVVLRRRIRSDLALVTKARGKGGHEEQLVLALGHDDVQETEQLWEYTVLATNTPYDIAAIGQLYRDRCDCENGFDELKNQWGRARTPTVLRTVGAWRGVGPLARRGLQGWGGFTTQDMHRSQLSARAVALVYNWWSWYVRAANPQARRADQSSAAAGGGGAGHPQRQPDHAVPHADACRNRLDQVDVDQCAGGHQAREGCCGAGRMLERNAAAFLLVCGFVSRL